jgi:hypothetical protein
LSLSGPRISPVEYRREKLVVKSVAEKKASRKTVRLF